MAGKRRGRASARRTVQSVVDHKICCGCGACAALCPVNCIEFVYGKRYNYPKVDTERCTGCGRCLEVCPSEFLLHGTDPGFQDRPQEAALSCHLVHASDDQIRHEGASGGVSQAFSSTCWARETSMARSWREQTRNGR